MSDFYERLAKIESNNDPAARSKTSSATGLYQMTRGTFDSLREQNPDLARFSWEQHASDPNIQRKFANALTRQNDQLLSKKGYALTDLNRYLAHFAGASGADKLLSSNPGDTIERILGKKVAQANNMLGKTVGEVKNYFAKKLGSQANGPTQSPAVPLPDILAPLAGGDRPDSDSFHPRTSSLFVIPSSVGLLSGTGQGLLPDSPTSTKPVQLTSQSGPNGETMAKRGGLIDNRAIPRYKEGEVAQGDSKPWEDYKNASSDRGQVSALGSSSQEAPWNDYKANTATPSFGEKARDFLGQVFSNTASALNTRPDQITGKDRYGLPTFGEPSNADLMAGPTNAARRAGRTAGFIQGAAVDLPAAIGQISGVGRDSANSELSGYQNFRQNLGMGNEWDVSRIAGNVASPVGNKTATGIEALLKGTGAGLFKRGAIQGGAAALQQPLDPNSAASGSDVLLGKGLQGLEGIGLGGVFNKVLGRADPASIAAGKQSNIDRYKAMFPDADLTWGQHLGGRFNQAEQMFSSYPFVGNIIRDARNKSFDSQNVGMMNHALKDAGITLDKNTQAGRGMFDQAYNKLSNKYTELLDQAHLPDPQSLRAKIYGKLDTGTGKSLATPEQLQNSYTPGVISNKYNQLSEEGQKKFDRLIDNGLFKKFGKDPQGNHSLALNGNQFKVHEEDLKDTIDSLMHGGGEDREIGKMLKTSLGEAYNSLQSTNPQVAQQLKKLNKSYAQYKTLETASTASGASEGRFTPAQTIRAATKGARGQVARGKGLLQDEADLSQQVLGPHYPDSGTAGRLQSGNLARDLIGGAISLPLELAYSPKVASFFMGKGSGAKDLLGSTGLGAKVQSGAPTGVPAAVRGLMSPDSQQQSMARGGLAQLAGGGIVNNYLDQKVAQATLNQLTKQNGGKDASAPLPPPPPGTGPAGPAGPGMAAGGQIADQALGGGALAYQSARNQARKYGRGNTPVQLSSWGKSLGMARGGYAPKFDEGGQVDPASLVGMDDPQGPRIPALWDQYTSYLDKNISQGRRDMENGLNYSKEKGLYVKDPQAYQRTLDNMNLAGTFIGPSSKLWNSQAAKEFLAKEGKELAGDLWYKLGTGRDPTGNLKQEISDHLASLNAKALTRDGKLAKDVFTHPQLFESYPALENTQMALLNSRGSGGQAYESMDRLTGRKTPHIDINRAYYERQPDGGKAPLNRTALHEFQHLVQKAEGTPGGGSPGVEGAQMAKKLGILEPKETQMHRDFLQQMIDTAKQEGVGGGQLARLEEKLKDANKLVVNDAAKRKAYNRLYGEAEARLTERRQNLDDNARRMMYPFSHDKNYHYGYDVPVEELITGGYRGLPEMASYPNSKMAQGGLARYHRKR